MKHVFQIIPVLLVIILLVGSCTQPPNSNAITVTSNVDSAGIAKAKPIDKNLLAGDWVRADADYRIQINELQQDGKMKAGYFNPKSIHVEKAVWAIDRGLLKIYIVLKDENYPGSNYDLIYLPEKNLLAGKYFQAVEGTTYDVMFERKK